jgi:hypothetical protein
MITRSEKISILSLIIVAGFAFGVAYHYYEGLILQRPYPWNTFLFHPSIAFTDFGDVIREGKSLNPYLQYKSAQYPFLVIIGYIFSSIPYNFIVYTALFCASFLAFGIVFLAEDKWYKNATHIFIITFLSYPFLFALDRGNFEGLLSIILLAFILLFTQKNFFASAIILAFAISMKLLPIILLVLFVPEKKYREIVLCIAATILITFISLLFFRGGLVSNLDFLLHTSNISSNYVFKLFTSIESNIIQRGVALLALIKIFYYETGLLPRIIYRHFSQAYLLLAGLIGLPVMLYVIFIEQEIWKRVTLLVFMLLILPTISADYKLLHIFLPLYLFINNKKASRLDLIYLISFGILLIPKDYYYFQKVITDAPESPNDVSISVVINILTIIITSLIIIINGLTECISRLRKSIHPEIIVQ